MSKLTTYEIFLEIVKESNAKLLEFQKLKEHEKQLLKEALHEFLIYYLPEISWKEDSYFGMYQLETDLGHSQIILKIWAENYSDIIVELTKHLAIEINHYDNKLRILANSDLSFPDLINIYKNMKLNLNYSKILNDRLQHLEQEKINIESEISTINSLQTGNQ